MNNIRWLMDEAEITNNMIRQYTGISSGGITVLYKGDRQIRENHIDRLTYFFNVTSDFLLGKSDDGIGIYTEDDSNIHYINKETYMRIKDSIYTEVTESILPVTIEIVKTRGENKKMVLNEYITRRFNGSIRSLKTKRDLLEEYAKNMDDEQVDKTVKFIETFVL